MQLSLSLSSRGASSLAAALCLDSCRDLSTARWRCFTWGRAVEKWRREEDRTRGNKRIHGGIIHFGGASEERREEEGKEVREGWRVEKRDNEEFRIKEGISSVGEEKRGQMNRKEGEE